MKTQSLLLLSLLFVFSAGAQSLHTPDEIFKLLSNSKLSYEIQLLNKTIPCPDRSKNVIDHNYYRRKTNSGLTLYKFSINKKAKPLFDKAEFFFQSKMPDSALVYYQLALNADTSLYFIMTYIGQIYEMKNEMTKAMDWYKKAIDKNYIDYMAHWFLADAYADHNKLKKATDEIVVAQILNRNNPRIKVSMKNIFEKSGRDTTDWCFQPQMQIIKTPNKIIIATSKKWMGYALAKALWLYEPGYRKSMGVTGNISTLEEKECLFSLLVALKNGNIDIKNDPALYTLQNAVKHKEFNAYLLYEVILPQYPIVASQLPKPALLEIKDYILKTRNKK